MPRMRAKRRTRRAVAMDWLAVGLVALYLWSAVRVLQAAAELRRLRVTPPP